MIKLNKSVIIIFIGIILMSCHEKIDITKYKGDGKISLYGNELFYPGFKIEFDEIDLSSGFSKQYNLSNLPEINKTYVIGLYAESGGVNIENKFRGILRMQLSNKNGKIFDVYSDLKNWRISRISGQDYKKYFVYYRDKNKRTSFEIKDLKNEKSLTLLVEFTPKKGSKKLFAKVLLKAGGFK